MPRCAAFPSQARGSCPRVPLVLPECSLRASHFASHLRAPFGARGKENFVLCHGRGDSPRRGERPMILREQTHALRALRAIALRDGPPHSLRSEGDLAGSRVLLPQHIACTIAAFYAENVSKNPGSGTPKGVLARRRLSEARLRAGRAEDRGGGSCASSWASFPPSWPSCGGPLGGRASGGSVGEPKASSYFSLFPNYGGTGAEPQSSRSSEAMKETVPDFF